MKLDKQWELFNRDIQGYIPDGDLYRLGNTYYEMADFVKKEGKDNTYLIDLGYKVKLELQIRNLKELKGSGIVTMVEIIACTNCPNPDNNSCDICKNLNGKIIPIDEALLSNPLPVKDCTHPYRCRCCYGPSI